MIMFFVTVGKKPNLPGWYLLLKFILLSEKFSSQIYTLLNNGKCETHNVPAFIVLI